jgi:DNA-binding NtrC family response regulator
MTVTIPVAFRGSGGDGRPARATSPSGAASDGVGAPPHSLGRVLLVEDDGTCRASLRRQLVRAGFDVQEAANGLEALHFLNRRMVDVLATDVRMPTMSGLALMDAITAEHPEIPLVVYSGAQLVDPGLGAKLAVRHVRLLQKPFRTDDLVAALLEALERARGPAGPVPAP